jgi:beta-RFAP synthase
LPPCRIAVCQSPEAHTGVGTGTQLGLAVAAGLNALFLPDAPRLSAAELAASSGRGHRSAVGTYGFQLGGLIFEPGKRPGEPIAPLKRRVPLPTEWRFLLLRRGTGCGLSGDVEKRAFDQLPPVPTDATCQLTRLASEEILPAAEAGRFDEFAEAVYKYGYLAGACFAQIQGSAFAGPEIAELVQTLRDWGVRGVGQSSWGPTVFAVLPNSAAAEALEARLRRTYPPNELSLTATAANNLGARIEIS